MSLLFKISPRLCIAIWTAWYGFRYGPVSNAINAIYFIKLAWHFLCGRLMIVTTENPVSNGGWRYYAIVISKRPLSGSHQYDDL